jgi:predicted ArsR family transcriptional regulator
VKLEVRLLEYLADGPDTSDNIADELGIPMKNASAVLSQLRDDGFVKVTGKYRLKKAGRPMNIWSLA